MESFKRLFKYLWPQWPSIIVAVTSALVIAILLSCSLITIIPLLKVMIGKEGLHGWADRETCYVRYGMDFYVPEWSDYVKGNSNDVSHYLVVSKVKKGSLAYRAGIRSADRIFGVGSTVPRNDANNVMSPDLLQELAAVKAAQINVLVKRLNKDETFQSFNFQLFTLVESVKSQDANDGVKELIAKRAGAIKWKAQMWGVGKLQRLVSFVPRGQENKFKAIIYIVILITIVTVIRCIAKYYQGYLAQKIVSVGLCHLREDAFAHVVDLPVSYFASEKPSDTVSRLIRDTDVMGKAIKVMLGKALTEPLNALIMIVAAATICSWQLTLIFLGGAPMALWTMGVLGKRMKKATKKTLMAWSQMLAKLREVLMGLKVVKVYGQQDFERQNFTVISRRLLKQQLKTSKVDAATSPLLEVLGMFAGAAALIVGADWVVRQGSIDGESFLVLLILLGAAAEAVRKSADIWNTLQEANAASERVFTIMDTFQEAEQANAVEFPPLREKIEFRNVVFKYPGSETPVLNGVSLTVKAGHNIAVVGPNGSGKTTLINLLPRFYELNDGAIFIDGRNIRESTLKGLRSKIGMVTQNVVTFNDTIAVNIAYGKTDATKEEIISAAKRAFAHEFIEPLPNGYETMIGEDGVGLSGGQLQRIIIARAILKNPEILIFDEATSQVDADSEAKIHQAIEEIMANRTSFVIAHRFSTIISADVIVVMDKGKIIAHGKHDELIKSCRLYQTLYETQLIIG